MRFIIPFLLPLILLGVGDLSPAQEARLIKKGAKIATKLCGNANLSTMVGRPEEIAQLLQTQKPCGDLSPQYHHALAYYLAHRKEVNQTTTQIEVPNDSKCPVCGMFVYKYPKWSARMVINQHVHYFDGVKDMMKYYIFDTDFPFDRAKINSIEVSDFYTLDAIPAKTAYYVIGSDVFGPMGDELIPFKTQKEAQGFMEDHKGIRMVRFEEIDAKMLMRLDGL